MKTKATKPATDKKATTTVDQPKPATNGHKPTPLNQPLPEGMLGTKEVAARLKIEPRHLRVVLRSMGKGTGGERYMWKEGSPELAKIAEAVKEHAEKK